MPLNTNAYGNCGWLTRYLGSEKSEAHRSIFILKGRGKKNGTMNRIADWDKTKITAIFSQKLKRIYHNYTYRGIYTCMFNVFAISHNCNCKCWWQTEILSRHLSSYPATTKKMKWEIKTNTSIEWTAVWGMTHHTLLMQCIMCHTHN